MKRVRKWLIRIGIVLLVILIVLAGAGAWFVRRPWPQVGGTIDVSGLLAPVEVIRDKWGVPNIYAQNEHDLFFAQGYVHAQDRLWQMETNRRLCNGTMSSIAGQSTLELDLFMRIAGLRRVAEESWSKLDSDSRTILEAYTEGVNAYIDTHQNRLPLEFAIMGFAPRPWSPIDSLAWGNMVAIYGSHNYKYELLRALLIPKVGEEAVQQFFPSYDEDTPLIIPAEASGYDWLRDVNLQELAEADSWRGNLSLSWASNNWVVQGSYTESGAPILANDVHTALWMSLNFYENGLHGGRFDSVGFSFPGTPLIIVGHNQHIAWGITILNADVQDAYIEKLDDTENPTQYEFMGQWYDLDVIQETFNVRGSEPLLVNTYLTRHGPIMNDFVGGWWGEALKMPPDEPLSFRWAVHDGSVVLRAIVLLNLAENWDEFRTALQYWDTVSQNFVYADVDGNIGYQAAGKVPIRAPGHQGTVPVPGWTGEYEWQGFIPFDELPSVLNPPQGFVVTANNKTVSDDYPYFLTYDDDPGYRARRITDLLSASDQLTVEDMQNIQGDTYSLLAESLRPYLLAVESENELQAKALAEVEAWDLYYTTDSVAASIYETWYLFLLTNTIGDECGEGVISLIKYLEAVKHGLMMIELMADPGNVWFDDTSTPEVEMRDDIIHRSWTEAVDWLAQQYGEDVGKWEWGRMHTTAFVHIPFGYIDPLRRVFNSRTVPTPGSMFSVNAAWYFMDQPFESVYGVVLRTIVDPSNWDNMLAISPPGQSRHLFHSNRDDQSKMWQQVEYHSLPFSREAVETNAKDVLTLRPPQ